jgi:pimeloyl-ACP methyl ester carboxylesterase
MQSMLTTGTVTSNSAAQTHITSLVVENIPIRIVEEGAGVPTLLLHGIFDSADTWRGVTARLKSNYRCLAPDLPGFGRSGEPADFDFTLQHMAEFIDHLIAALGIDEPINLIAYDIGATYGLAWAVTHPAKVRHLAILNANFFSDYTWHPFARLWRIPVVGELVMAALTETTFARAMVNGAPQIPPDRAREAAQLVTPAAKRMALRHYRALDSAVFRGWEDRLRDLTRQVPTIVCWGDQDPAIAPTFADRFGAQEVHHFAANSHWLPLETPDELAERLNAFFHEDSR